MREEIEKALSKLPSEKQNFGKLLMEFYDAMEWAEKAAPCHSVDLLLSRIIVFHHFYNIEANDKFLSDDNIKKFI